MCPGCLTDRVPVRCARRSSSDLASVSRPPACPERRTDRLPVRCARRSSSEFARVSRPSNEAGSRQSASAGTCSVGVTRAQHVRLAGRKLSSWWIKSGTDIDGPAAVALLESCHREDSLILVAVDRVASLRACQSRLRARTAAPLALSGVVPVRRVAQFERNGEHRASSRAHVSGRRGASEPRTSAHILRPIADDESRGV